MFAELYKISEKSKHRIAIMLLLALAIFASAPCFVPLTSAHDIAFHLLRIEGIAQGLSDGAFPVRMQYSQMQGLGYPVSIMYPDIVLYFPALLHLIGLSVANSYRVFVIVFNVFVVFSTYIFAKRFSQSRIMAFTIALVWALGTYRLVDVYLRASVGEYCALAAFPFIAYGLWCAFCTRGKESTSLAPCIWIAFGMIGVVSSHIISILLAVFGLIGPLLTCAIYGDRKCRGWLSLLAGTGITVLLLLWMIVPFFSWYLSQDMRVDHFLDKVSIQHIGQRAGTLGQLLTFFPTFSGRSKLNADGTYQEMPLSLGLGGVFLVGCAFMSILIKNKTRTLCKNNSEKTLKTSIFIMLVVLLICVALCCCYFLWHPSLAFMKILSNIQYPWRFLGPILFIAVIVGLLALVCFTKCQKLATCAKIICVLVCVLSVAEGGHSLASLMYEKQKAASMESLLDSQLFNKTVTGGEYLPANIEVKKINEKLEHMQDDTDGYTVAHHADGGRVFDITFDKTNTKESVELPLIYYDGYQIVDSTPYGTDAEKTGGSSAAQMPSDDVVLRCNESGFIELASSTGVSLSGTFHIKWVEPTSWRIATVISMLSFVFFIVYILYQVKRKSCFKVRKCVNAIGVQVSV